MRKVKCGMECAARRWLAVTSHHVTASIPQSTQSHPISQLSDLKYTRCWPLCKNVGSGCINVALEQVTFKAEIYNSDHYYRQTSLDLIPPPPPLHLAARVKTHPTTDWATFRIPHITHRSAEIFRTFHSAFYLPHSACRNSFSRTPMYSVRSVCATGKMQTCGPADFLDLKMTKPNYKPNTDPNSNPNTKQTLNLILSP